MAAKLARATSRRASRRWSPPQFAVGLRRGRAQPRVGLALGGGSNHSCSTSCRFGLGGVGSVRYIRAGFFPEDEDYVDPEAPLLAERLGVRWRLMDDPTLRAPVLERSNVGMGMLVLNRPAGLDLAMINTAYTRLRNLEVNTLKRFVGLTAVDPGPFCVGLDPKELLLASTVAAQHGRLPRFARALLWHHQELAHLVADYRKPLVAQLSGQAHDGGAALACLANYSGAHEESEVSIAACSFGLVPMGGLTYLLAGLPWHLGEYLALTGLPLRGPDIVFAGLARHWLSPDALPFLELTAEKHLEVSETDSRALLDEHSLPVPDGLGEGDSLPRRLIPLIHQVFGETPRLSKAATNLRSVQQIVLELEEIATGSDAASKHFAEVCLERMSKQSPLALHATLRLVQRSRFDRALGEPQRTIGGHGHNGPLVAALRRELRVQERLLGSPDANVGLHARCLGRGAPAQDQWSRRIKEVVAEEVDDLLAPAANSFAGGAEEFAVSDRSEFSLSSHPRLKRYHPDYDPVTGLDHDPAWMAAEVRRWDPDLFADERRRTVQELLKGRGNPSSFGLSRWTRVEEERVG